MKRLSLVLLIVANGYYAGRTQNTQNKNWNYHDEFRPVPPAAASFQSYGKYDIDLYTGTPNINIPLFTIEEEEINIPITLQYSATGVKVSDITPWVGLGWGLNPGGYISQHVVGGVNEPNYNMVERIQELSDLTPNFVQGVCQDFETDVDITSSQAISFYSRLAERGTGRPDLYVYNFLGYSGKFYLVNSISPPGDYKIIHVKKPQELYFEKTNEGWTVQDVLGREFFFNTEEITSTTELTGAASPPVGSSSSTWKLSKIKMPGGSSVDFTYQDVNYTTYSDVVNAIDYKEISGTPGHGLLPIRTPRYFRNQHNLSLKYLQRIDSKNYTVNFTISQEANPKLDSIKIRHKGNPSISRIFSFLYQELNEVPTSIFCEETLGNRGYPPDIRQDCSISTSELPVFDKYLLTQVKEVGLAPFLFEYYDNLGLPNYFSTAQDYWGFYNGVNDNPSLLPDEENKYVNDPDYLGCLRSSWLKTQVTANRGPSNTNNCMLQGTLNKIIYPTKGYTVFNFEPHEFNSAPTSANHLRTATEIATGISAHENAPSIGGGIRIAAIKNYDYGGQLQDQLTYDYANDLGITTGKLLNDIKFSRSTEMDNFRLHVTSGGVTAPVYTLYSLFYCSSSISSTNQVNLTLRGPSVGYGQVSETSYKLTYISGPPRSMIPSGSTTYYFKNSQNLPCRIGISPGRYTNGLVDSIVHKNNNDQTIKSVKNRYELVKEASEWAVDAVYTGVVPRGVVPNIEHKEQYRIYMYPMKYERWEPSKKIETEYDLAGSKTVSTETFYEYHSDGRLFKTSTAMSDGGVQYTIFLYPNDYDDTNSFVSFMKSRNITHLPIEEVTYIEKDNQTYVIAGKITKYSIDKVSQVKILEIDQPLPIAEFKFSNRSLAGYLPPEGVGLSSSFTPDSRYVSKVNLTYSAISSKRTLVEVLKTDDYPGHMIWGYDDSKVIALIKNGSLENCYYESFEEDLEYLTLYGISVESSLEKRSSDKRAGKYSLSPKNSIGTGTITVTVQSPGTGNYIVSFWAKSWAMSPGILGTVSQPPYYSVTLDNTWRHYQFKIPSVPQFPIELDRVFIDELKVYPESAQMEAFTYEPLFGITSVNDPSGNLELYEYDANGRLIYIRDGDNNILKKFEYHYQK